MTDDQLAALHDVIQFALWGTIDTSAQSRADFVAAVKGGQSVEAIISGWQSNPAAASWTDLLNTLRGLDYKTLAALVANAQQQVKTLKGLLA